MQDKQIKIGAVALVIALLALSQATAISSLYNYHFFNGTNISIIDDGFGNITISTNANGVSDSTKINKTGDIVPHNFNLSTITGNSKITFMDNVDDDFYGIELYTNASNFNGYTGAVSTNNGIPQMGITDGVNLNSMSLYPTYALFTQNINMNGNNISNCGNCLTNETMASDNTKLNNTGDNIYQGTLYINEKPNYATTNVTLGDNVGLRILSNLGNTLLCSSWNKYVTSCSLEDVNLSDYNNNYAFVNNSTVDKKLSNYTNNYNWVNNSTMSPDNTKVNDSGDSITGEIIFINNSYSQTGFRSLVNTAFAGAGIPYFSTKNNGNYTSELSISGVQLWHIYNQGNTNISVGYILYATPGGYPGIVLYNSSIGQRTNIRMTSTGIRIESSNTNATNSQGITITNQDYGSTIVIDSLSGSGTRAVCVDSTGQLVSSTNATSNYKTC